MRRTLLFLLVVVAVPLFAHERKVFHVIVDPAANRAYIPEGTVLPAGMQLRASVKVMPVDGFALQRPRAGERVFEAKKQSAMTRQLRPLVFEYAPAERFNEVRARVEQRRRESGRDAGADSHNGGCATYHFYIDGTGMHGTYTTEFIALDCDPGVRTVGQYGWWTYGAMAAAEDDGYVFVFDDNGNYVCDDSGGGYRTRSCEAESYQQWAGAPVNNIHFGWHTALIEWLEGYQPNYVWFNLEASVYRYHY
jgi:hypothetical protein